MAVNTQPIPRVAMPFSFPSQGTKDVKAFISGDYLEMFQYAIVRGSIWTPGARALECPTVSSQAAEGGGQLPAVGCTQIRGDPFPHFLPLGVPAKGERRGA